MVFLFSDKIYHNITAISSRPSYLDYIPCVATPSWGPPTKVFVVPLPTGPYAWAMMLFSLHTANISLSFIYGLNSNSLTTGTTLHLKIYMCTALKQFFFLSSYFPFICEWIQIFTSGSSEVARYDDE